MANSDEFFRKTGKTDDAGRIDSAFSECMPCSDEMSQELCNTLRFGLFARNNNPDSNDKYKSVLGCIIDLFDMDYDDNDCSLAVEIWEIIRDVTNAYANELDEDLMTYVFQQIMSRGLI